ncbi:MAG: hypothetical protein L0I76_03885 [Pseudonocardia sp.]|nr:hypothetical protein [Pseudonocardia sp.]
MRRGEVWRYVPRGSPREQIVVIVSSDGLNESTRSWLLAAPVLGEDPQDILAVPVPGQGWVSAGNLARYYRGWFAEHLGALDPSTVHDLESALRAALDL